MLVDVVCEVRCGFRAGETYFRDKTHFEPGICPRCNSQIDIVRSGTEEPVEGHTISKVATDFAVKGQIVEILGPSDSP